ncbi:class I SAM-dependent RNA methyltransferase [Sinomonas sp. JGH33]|uniref:Class I SAM-dependent RNA methyltransferase n=1 Tax=Sinomonas terricola TaxID=3110330 RepID=A0ABU5T3U1_9MICC|nr:class I SAM-dependent RNA methyltransferase [Sinomonas sp. JGH33]MEA5454283.1 class I SAM-dependent RNA methyltransferase [Sinomonas sp. JGH33]
MSDLLELQLGPIAHGGHTVARHEGRVVFVRHGLPGEAVRVRLTEAEEGKTFWRGDVVDVIEASPARRPHVWAPADALAAYAEGRLPVGGAEFGHIELAEQRRLKAAVVREQLARLAHLELDVEVEAVPAEAPRADAGTADDGGLHWRTRCSFAVDGDGRLAMHAHRSTETVAVHDMPLAVDAISRLGLWGVDLAGVERVEVAAPASGTSPLVVFTLAEELPSTRLRELVEGVDLGASVSAVGPRGKAPLTLRGHGSVAEEAAGYHYTVTGEGFWQIHRKAPETLMEAVLGAVGPVLGAGATAADLYAGAGLFTAPLAAAVGPSGFVLSVEGSPGTSRDARRTFKRHRHVDVVQGRVERVLRQHSGERFDAVVLDPPRAGAGREVVRQLVDAAPGAVAYVACDPASFARDLGWFLEAGWRLEWLRAFDLYPQTHHVETVALLRPGR